MNGIFAGRFEVFVFGGRNTVFSWSQMAFVAPLDVVEGGLQRLELKDGIHTPNPDTTAPEPAPIPGGPEMAGADSLLKLRTGKMGLLLCLWAGPAGMYIQHI